MDRSSLITEKQLVDAHEVRQALQHYLSAGQVAELRILDAVTPADRWPHTATGYFNDADKLVEALEGICSAAGIYFTPNPVNPALLARAANRIRKAGKGESTGNKDILSRRWLLLDFDAVRPAGISATQDEHNAALKAGELAELFLHDLGCPDPIRTDSGNGCHLDYLIDLPADDGGLCQGVIAAVGQQFATPAVKVDGTTFNAARIWRLPGTLACKGDDVPDRPHRMSSIIAAPEELQVVPRSLLEELAATAPAAPVAESNGAGFDLDGFIQRHGFELDGPDPYKGAGRKWTFRQSPLCDHHDDGPYLIQFANGALSAGCHHDSCRGRWGWSDLRAKFDPKPDVGLYDRLISSTANGAHHNNGSDKPAGVPTSGGIVYQRITSAELASGDYAVDFAIENTMATGEPLIVGGPQKVLKTSLLIDAAVSLSVAGCFLGKLRATRARRVAVMTGESGLSAIQDTALRICKAAGVSLASLKNLIWSTDLPKFGNAKHLEALEKFLTGDALEVLAIDPAYMTMPGADAGNLMMQGELLRSVNDVCRRCGVTLMLAHHTTRASGRDSFEPLQLHDLAWAGFSEFAAQWWLINRRERYEPGTGEHRLWLTVGGRAGHSALWALDVNEGLRTDRGGRRWDVDLQPASEAREVADKRRAEAKEQKRLEQVEADAKAVTDALKGQPDRTATKSEIRLLAGRNTSQIDAALAMLLQANKLRRVAITKGNNRSYGAFQLVQP